MTAPDPSADNLTGTKETIAIIGSGNWGSAIARLAAINARQYPEQYERTVKMYVFEEEFEGKKLTETINEMHINAKYLPDIDLGDNLLALPDLLKTVEGATALVFVLPHQFLPRIISQLKGHVPAATRAISCIKGVEVHEDRIDIFARVIEQELGMSCSALSGANIAAEVARDCFSETTIGAPNPIDGALWQRTFATDHFRVQVVDDVAGVSLCGALKNIVAVAAGFIDGLQWGDNSKAAIMRLGLLEMKAFCHEFFPGVKDVTFLEESAGVADLITTCLGGRNRKCAEAFVTTGKSFEVLEKEMLGGQKLQGIYTAKEINVFLTARGRVDAYPLFHTVHQIAWEGLPPTSVSSKL